MRKNNRAARAARTKYNSAPQKEKNLSKSTKALKKSASNITITICLGEDYLQGRYLFTNIDVTFHLSTTEHENPRWHIAKAKSNCDVTDIIGIFPSPEYRRVSFSRGNTFRSRLFLCQILQFLLPRHVAIHFFIFAVIVA